jgi:hypothetical protein
LLRGVLIDGFAYYMGKNMQKHNEDQTGQNSGVKGGTTSAASDTRNKTTQLNELDDMYQNGLLSEKEFERAKAKLLKGK